MATARFIGWLASVLVRDQTACVGCDDALLTSQMLVSELCWAFDFFFARAGDFDAFNIVGDVGVKGGACGDIAGDMCGDLS